MKKLLTMVFLLAFFAGITNSIAQVPGIYQKKGFPAGHDCSLPANQNKRECQCLKAMRDIDSPGIFVTAHRGSWNDNLPEGGLGSLRNAVRQGFMFVELDVIRSKDNVLCLLHDQCLNRMIDFDQVHKDKGYRKPEATDQNFWIRNLNYKNATYLGTRYVPPLNVGYMLKRNGQKSSERVATLNNALDYAKNKEVVICIDIKEADEYTYCTILWDCLDVIASRGMLHKVVFKPQTDNRKKINPATISNHFNTYARKKYGNNKTADDKSFEHYRYLEDNTNVIVINFETNIAGTDQKEWMYFDTVIAWEHIYKYENNDPFLTGSPSIIQRFKELGWKNGINWELPTDCRGSFDGRGGWNDRTQVDGTNRIDMRGNPEWLLSPPYTPIPSKYTNSPRHIVADSPVIAKWIIENLKLGVNPYSFSTQGFKL